MPAGQTGFDDVTFDPISVKRHEFLRELGGTDNTSPQ